MNILNAIIVDDMNRNIDTLKILLETYCPMVNVVHTANDITTAAIAIHQYRPQILFLDIELNNATGFDLLSKFAQPSFHIIFTTAYSQYAVDAFKVRAVDYLLKPINILELQEAVAKVEAQVKQESLVHTVQPRVMQKQKIALPTLEGIKYLNCENITHCDASGSYTIIHTNAGEKILVSMRLKECADLLPEFIFFRIHHSHIINVNFVEKLIRAKLCRVILSTGADLPLAASRREDFLELMSKK
ncbi:MAG: response regulator transcription factor [Sphingobacteriales bacterium]|nr:MAG: response regulator transcription factor [Sphingobacteriales bacterium]